MVPTSLVEEDPYVVGPTEMSVVRVKIWAVDLDLLVVVRQNVAGEVSMEAWMLLVAVEQVVLVRSFITSEDCSASCFCSQLYNERGHGTSFFARQ